MGEHPPSGPFAASGLSFKSASPRIHRKVLGTEVNYRYDVGAFLAPWDRDGLRGALSAFCGAGGMDSPSQPRWTTITDGSGLSSWEASSWGHCSSFMWLFKFIPNPHQQKFLYFKNNEKNSWGTVAVICLSCFDICSLLCNFISDSVFSHK